MTAHTISKLIKESIFGIFSDQGFLKEVKGIEIDRVVREEGEHLITYLRVRNVSNKPLKIYSFLISEFNLNDVNVEKVLENGWLQCSDVGFKSLDQKTIKNVTLLLRDQNPHSFEEKYGYLKDSIISEWFTLLKMYGDDIFIGAVTTKDQFSQIYIKKEEGVKIRITSQFDGLTLSPGQVVQSEKIFIAMGPEAKIEKGFALTLKKEMNVKNPPPPIRAMCCSYYWNENNVTDELIQKELDAIEALPQKLNLDYIQIDAGYTKYFGDWLDYKERFPNGFEPIIKRIKDMGYKAGIWLSPFAVNPVTNLHRKNPGWFLKGVGTQLVGDRSHFEGRMTSPLDTLNNMMELEVFDPTNPEVEKYITDVLKHFKDLGFALFKLDFLYPVCLAEKYSRPLTRAQALRHGMEYIKKAVGDSPILSGITPISPLVGLVDFVRTGIDTLNPYVVDIPLVDNLVNSYMITKNDEETKDRMFLNGIIWRADPDVQVFRKGTGINEKLIQKHMSLSKDNNMCLWVGDSISLMDQDTKAKVVNFFS